MFEKLKVIKKLTGGHHAEAVYLLAPTKLTDNGENVVRKHYKMNHKKSEKQFKRELKIMKHLTNKKCTFTPKLLSYNEKKGILWMSYCGENLIDSQENRKKVFDLNMKLKNEYQLIWKYFPSLQDFLAKKSKHNIIHNVTKKGDQIFLIDFGNSHWQLL